jgi:hypothetical protein
MQQALFFVRNKTIKKPIVHKEKLVNITVPGGFSFEAEQILNDFRSIKNAILNQK